ncbi:hypothetical protein [Mahella australiensis]|uniref:Uncharacterized protein n=1 Tax=Mahella australiensis (strain DSM 15567 / CIP 107919 / 50-1 BON) TaxID=697281 RepID=F3ZZW7_MAHA5|nr:hypothetical protein [Mahella australiensis]AEE97964.1 hypothetical protein Mahau_2839 [Mahella australiensis 50-1 BON]
MEREMKTKPGGKLISKIASALPCVLMYLCIFCLTFAVINGLTEGIRFETKAETLAAENGYLKGELERFKAQLVQETGITDADAADALLYSGD